MNVLIIDDQSSARSAMRYVVEGIAPGVHAVEFENPDDALTWSQDHEADLLLLDYEMPGMDGLQLARRFSGMTKVRDAPILMVSAFDDPQLRQAAFDAGAIEFLHKPVSPRELRARCRNLLVVRQMHESVKTRVRSLETQLRETSRDTTRHQHDILLRIAKAVDVRDNGDGMHFTRVGRFAKLIASNLNLADDDVRTIELAAPLHDIGKVGIPEAILHKQEPFTEDEFTILSRHSKFGFEILSGSQDPFVQLGATLALRHHEHWDGSGYPHGLQGEEIPLPARIVAVADAFDALRSGRTYRSAWTRDKAVDYIQDQSGRIFDPVCVNALFDDMTHLRTIEQTSAT